MLTISVRPVISKYWTNLRQIARVGRTLDVDDQPKISFSIPKETLP